MLKLTDIDWECWKPKDIATLVFVFQAGKILLIRKKRGLGQGKINAPGGKVDYGESLEEAAIREIKEEVCIDVWNLEYAGDHQFQFDNGYSMHVHVFRTEMYKGQPQETDEAIPMWIDIDQIPYEEMWEDDEIWIPLMLKGIVFSGRYVFSESKMLDYQLITSRS